VTRDISISESVSGYYMVTSIPDIDGNVKIAEQSFPIIIYHDVAERRYTYYGMFDVFRSSPQQGVSTDPSLKLIVWSDGTIIWRFGNQGEPHAGEYRLAKIDNKRIEKFISDITQKGGKYFSRQPRKSDIRFAAQIDYGVSIMFPNFFYKGRFTADMLAHDVVIKSNKEEKVAFIKRSTGYFPHGFRGQFLLRYKDLLPGQEQCADDVLSDDDIYTIAPYLFDDINFFNFCRNACLSLIPANDEGIEIKIRFSNRDNYLIAVEYYNDEKYRYEYHCMSLDEFLLRRGLLLNRHIE